MDKLRKFFNSRKKVIVASLIVVLLASVGVGVISRRHDNQMSYLAATAVSNEADFPNITIYPSKSGEVKGRVIYIPQIHRMPGADFADSANDPGYTTQKEIYGYLNILADEYGIKFFMTESGMYGELPEKYTAPVREAMITKEEFSREYKSFIDTLNPRYEHLVPQMNSDIKNGLSMLDRNIYLRGANIKFEAERGDEVLTYGSQNQETYDQTVQLVRERLAIQKKLKGSTSLSENVDIGEILKLMLKNRGSSHTSELLKKYLQSENSVDISRSFAPLEKEARRNNDYETLNQLENLESMANEMDSFLHQPISAIKVSNTQEPIRLPSDRQQLQALARENKKKFDEIVVTKRSYEAVDNFLKGIEESGNQTGVLVYGAGHGEQIVDGLTSRGYEVTVINPRLVKQKYPQL